MLKKKYCRVKLEEEIPYKPLDGPKYMTAYSRTFTVIQQGEELSIYIGGDPFSTFDLDEIEFVNHTKDEILKKVIRQYKINLMEGELKNNDKR